MTRIKRGGTWGFRAGLSPQLQSKFGPDRRVIGWFLSLSHVPIDSGIGAFVRECFAREDRVYAQPAILRERQHAVIPPTEKSWFRVVQSQGVRKPGVADPAQRRAFLLRTHDGTAPEVGVMHIAIVRRHVQI